MAGLNRLELIGNLTREMEVKTIGELIVATNTIAVNEKTGKEDITTYVNFKAFGKKAEIMGEFLKKGSKAYVSGSLRSNDYAKKDGSKVYSFELIVDDFTMLDSKKTQESEVK